MVVEVEEKNPRPVGAAAEGIARKIGFPSKSRECLPASSPPRPK